MTAEVGTDLREVLRAREDISWRVVRVVLDNAMAACGAFDIHRANRPKNADDYDAWAPIVARISEFVAQWDARLAGKAQDDPVSVAVVDELTRDMSALALQMRAMERQLYRSRVLSANFVYHNGDFGGASEWAFRNAVLEAYREMSVGSDAEYLALPAEVRACLEAPKADTMLLRWRQMFGAGTVVQDVGKRMAGKVLLLQVCSDRRVGMIWGDVGYVKYWIAPKDLAAGRWDAVVVTFEGS